MIAIVAAFLLMLVDKRCSSVLLPQVEQKIATELESHGLLATPQQPEPRVPEYNDLAKLTYLSCVIKESMRMHTVSTVTCTVNAAEHVVSTSSVAQYLLNILTQLA